MAAASDDLDQLLVMFSTNLSRLVAASPTKAALVSKLHLLGGADFLFRNCTLSSDDKVIENCAVALRAVFKCGLHGDSTMRLDWGNEHIRALHSTILRCSTPKTQESIIALLKSVLEVQGDISSFLDNSSCMRLVKLSTSLLQGASISLKLRESLLAILYRLSFHSIIQDEVLFNESVLRPVIKSVIENCLMCQRALKSSISGMLWKIAGQSDRPRQFKTLNTAAAVVCNLLSCAVGRAEFSRQDGIALLISLLSMNDDDVPMLMLERATRALCNFMVDHPNQTQVVAQGAHLRLIHLLQMQNVSPGLLEQASAALCNATYEHDKNRTIIGGSSGVQAAVGLFIGLRCMAIEPQKGINFSNLAPRSWWLDYPDCYVLLDIHKSILVNAAALLGNLCKKNKTNRKLVLSSGGIHALLGTLMVVDSASPILLSQCARALGNCITKSDEAFALAISFDCFHILSVLIQVAVAHSVQERHIQQSGAATKSFSSPSAANSTSDALSAAGSESGISGGGMRTPVANGSASNPSTPASVRSIASPPHVPSCSGSSVGGSSAKSGSGRTFLAGGEWGEVVRCALFAMTSMIEAAVDRASVIVHLNAIGARQLFQQIISADAAIGTYARDQAIKLMSDLTPPPAAPAPADSAPALSRRPITVSPLNKSNDEELLQRPYSAPLDGGLKKEGSGLLHRLSDALSSLPRLHIQQLHNRLPVFRQLSPDANADDVSSQVPPPPAPSAAPLICHVPLSFRLRTATVTG